MSKLTMTALECEAHGIRFELLQAVRRHADKNPVQPLLYAIQAAEAEIPTGPVEAQHLRHLFCYY